MLPASSSAPLQAAGTRLTPAGLGVDRASVPWGDGGSVGLAVGGEATDSPFPLAVGSGVSIPWPLVLGVGVLHSVVRKRERAARGVGDGVLDAASLAVVADDGLSPAQPREFDVGEGAHAPSEGYGVLLTSPDVGGSVVSAALDGGDGIARGVLLGLGGPTTSVIGAAEEASPILPALCSATRLILAGEAYVAEEEVFVDQSALVLLLEPSSSLGPGSR